MSNEEIRYRDQYSLPYKFMRDAKRVLIIGGGGGNDAAAAVREDIPQIDVVEIDPVIVEIGKKYHPEHPYSKENVHIYVNDGRAFFESTQNTYDLIIMSSADAHTLSSSLTNIRLDHYLYTRECFLKTRQLLTKDGVLFITFPVMKDWIGERINNTIREVYGFAPISFSVRSDLLYGYGGYVFVSGKDEDSLHDRVDDDEYLSKLAGTSRTNFSDTSVNILTDDWPYLYLEKPSLPLLQVIFAVFILGFLFTLKNRVFSISLDWEFFFLGCGFLLYEFQNISKSSLLFGATWQSNVFIISGIMVFILIANLVVRHKLMNYKSGYVLLLASLLIQLLLPLHVFNYLPPLSKAILSVIYLNLPHLFSGVVFVDLFSISKNKGHSLGSNLMGSAVGGVLEMCSYLWGINSLVVLVIFFYGLAYLVHIPAGIPFVQLFKRGGNLMTRH